MFRRTKLCSGLALAFGGTLAMGVSPASAQQQLERVEITGSAIKRLDAETAVPVTVMRVDDLKKQGITSVEQIMAQLGSVQMQQGVSQSVGAGTGGATFADMRGIGANKTLVLLNGRRIANNALDSSAPDLNMIPFAAIDRVEVLRDGASAYYGTDAIGGVINFITRRDFTGAVISVSADKPEDKGGESKNANIGFGFGNLDTNGFNVFGFVDIQKQNQITGLQRPFNTREPGGLSPSTFPANWYQSGTSYNPTAPTGCDAPNLIPDSTGNGCQIATSAFVNYIPETERASFMLKGTLKVANDHRLGLEYFGSKSKVTSLIAPVPYGALWMNPTRPDGTANPFYPGNASGPAIPPGVTLDPTFLPITAPAGSLPGVVRVRWRDLVHGQRGNIDENRQQRFVASFEGNVAGWDYKTGVSYNENKYENRLTGYSDGPTIESGVLNGVINPFGAQSADGAALLATAGREGLLQTAKGTVKGVDAQVSRDVGEWFVTGRPAQLALGAEFRQEEFVNRANPEFAAQVVGSTGFDPATYSAGKRNVTAAYAEILVPVLKTLELTGSLRHDRYNDFGNTTNPKVSFRFQPIDQLLFRGSYSTGFRAPSLYELNAANTYTNTGTFDDPINCPGGVPIPGKSAADNCEVQFQRLTGGNKELKPEKAKNSTLGFVVEPTKDFTASVDFWWVKIKQSIGAIPDSTVLTDPVTYAYVYFRNPSGDLATDGSQCPNPVTCGYLDLRQTNLGGVNTNGVDLFANYRLNAGAVGNFGFTFQGTYVTKYEYQDGGDRAPWRQKVSRYSDGTIFRHQRNFMVNWSNGMFGAGLATHYKSGYEDQYDGNRVRAYETHDIYGTWNPLKALSLTLGVRNFTDKEPPFSNQGDVFQAGYDPRYSDPVGRTYYVRGSFTF